MTAAAIFDSMHPSVLAAVDITIGLLVELFDSIWFALNVVMGVLPSIFTCIASAVTCSVCAVFFNTATCSATCILSTTSTCSYLLGRSIALTLQTISHGHGHEFGDRDHHQEFE